jgi:uncharacterized lipoprotein YmbA
MLRTDSATMTPLYAERWAAPLADELRSALADALKRALGAVDLHYVASPQAAPVWRIKLDVQQFDLMAAGGVQLDATWRIGPVNLPGAARWCRSVVRVHTGTEAAALVRGQQRAVSELAEEIAAAIRGQLPAQTSLVQTLGCGGK